MEITVGMGELQVRESPCLLRAVGLGSCMALALYDGHTGIAGLTHTMLPYIEEAQDKSHSTRFVDVAVKTIIEIMKKRGSRIQDIKAKIFGGANMFPEIIASDSTMDVGKRNIHAVREELNRFNIEIIAEEVGDHVGRTVLFDTGDGSVLVKTTHSKGKKC